MAKLSDFKDRKEFMAYVRSQKNKNTQKKGKGLMNDLLKGVKNLAINEGEKLIRDKGNELLNKGIDLAVKKVKGGRVKGKGLLKDISKTVLKTGLNLIPMPNLVRDIGSNVGEMLIDKVSGGNINNNNMLIGKKSVMVKKNMAGGALRGVSLGGALLA